jgi:hypothetical protein
VKVGSDALCSGNSFFKHQRLFLSWAIFASIAFNSSAAF